MRSSINVLLAGLSGGDLVLLLLVIPVFALVSLPVWPADRALQSHYEARMLQFGYPLTMIVQTFTVGLHVAIAVERWLAVCQPFRVSVWCTVRRSWQVIGALALASVAYNVVRFWEYDIAYRNASVYGQPRPLLHNMSAHPLYMYGYFMGAYLVTHWIVPFAAICVLNVHVVVFIYRMRQERRKLTRQVG